MNLLTQNSKLKKTSILNNCKVLNFGISTDSCIFAKDCKKYCYAKSGAYIWSNVRPVFEKRLAETKLHSFVEKMAIEIKKKKPSHVRIHDSGDFYGIEYIKKWIQLMKWYPEIHFYCYTKSFILFRKVNLPENFTLICSLGGENDHLINIKIHRHARIFKNEKELKKAGYVNASKNDLLAIGKNYRIGLIEH